MRIAIDVSPLESGHKVRGVGFYLEHLKSSLLEYSPEHEYLFFSQKEEITKDIDLVHYPYFDPFFLTLPLAKKYKTVVTVHDLTPLVFPKHFPAGLKGNLRWQAQKFNLKKVDAIIADSLASKNDIINIIGIPKNKISVAYLAAGKEFQIINDTEKILKKFNLPEKFVLYVGDVTWNKNLPRLIKAVKKINVPLVLVGKSIANKEYDNTNPWNRDLVTVQSLIENEKNITALGFVEAKELVALYNAATLFAFPSVYEGFGLPIIEAMQSGCPVVTTNGGSIPEVAGDAAYFVDGYNVEDIAEGLLKVYESKNLQRELSKKGLQQAKNFSWKKTAEATLAVYSQVVNHD